MIYLKEFKKNKYMKKLLLLSSLLISGALFSQSWTEQNTNYPTTTPGTYTGDISVVSATTAWAMAQRTSTTNHQRYSKTTDGGTTWTTGTINVGSTTLVGVANITAVDGNTAWVSGFQATATPTALQGVYKTISGGSIWARQSGAAFSSGSFVNFVHFWDANNGVCMGDKLGGYYEIYTTTNGGSTWTRTPSANIQASTGNYGYTGKFTVKGNTIWFGTDAGELMRSTDKGLNWTTIATPIADFGGGTITTVAGEVAFKDDNTGVLIKNNLDATGATTSSELYRTVNGGTTWTLVPATGFYNGAIAYAGTSILVTGASSGTTAAGFGSAYSLNDGTTWTNIDGVGKTSLSFLSETVGFAGGFSTAGVGGAYKFTNNLGTAKFDENSFTAYPNPVNDVVTITNKDNATFNAISITDINGRTVKNVKADNVSELQVNVSELNSGIYFLNISSENGKAVKKFIKN